MTLDRINSLVTSAKEAEKRGDLTSAKNYTKEALTIIKAEINKAQTPDLKQKLMTYFDKVYDYATRIGSSSPKKSDSSQKSEGKNSGITLKDIIGHTQAKLEITENLIEPMLHPEINEKYQIEVSKGLMLYGPPGTGKTTLAKAVANEIDAAYHHVSCKDILDKYVGESERKLNDIFEEAAKSKRSIILFDEFDQIASISEGSNDTARRVVSLLKELLDGFSSYDNIFVLAATNYPKSIEFGIRRRLVPIYLGLPKQDEIAKILKLKAQGVPLSDDVNFEILSHRLLGYSGSDIHKLVNYAKRQAAKRELDSLKSNTEIESFVTMDDFFESVKRTPKSVTDADLTEFEEFQSELS